MNITPDLPFLNNYSPFTNERISVYKQSRTSLDTKDYFVINVKQISHLSKGVVMSITQVLLGIYRRSCVIVLVLVL